MLRGNQNESGRKQELKRPTILTTCEINKNRLEFYNYCCDWACRLQNFLGDGVSIKYDGFLDLCEFRWKGKFIARIYYGDGSYPPGHGFYSAESYVLPMSHDFKPDEVWEDALKLSVQRHIQEDIRSLRILNKKIMTKTP